MLFPKSTGSVIPCLPFNLTISVDINHTGNANSFISMSIKLNVCRAAESREPISKEYQTFHIFYSPQGIC